MVTAPLMPSDVLTEIDEATTARDALVARIKSGAKVAPGELATAEDAIRLAELRGELADRNEAERAEAVRVAEIDRIVLGFRSGVSEGPAQRAAEVEALYSEAVDVMTKLAVAAEQFVGGNADAAVRLGRLGDLPAGVDVGNRSNRRLNIDGASWPTRLEVIARLLGDASNTALGAVDRRVASTETGRRVRTAGTAHSKPAVDVIRRCCELSNSGS